MRIGIDLDGVIFDSERYYRAYGEFFDIMNGGNGQVIPESADVSHSYGWKDDLVKKFLELYLYEIENNAPIMPCTIEVLKQLKKEGDELYIITARGCLGEFEIDISRQRLKEIDVSFDGFCFRAKEKLQACQEAKIDVMIDDNIKHVETISKAGIKCLHFNDTWGLKCKNENCIEVHNWGEIYRKILALKK